MPTQIRSRNQHSRSPACDAARTDSSQGDNSFERTSCATSERLDEQGFHEWLLDRVVIETGVDRASIDPAAKIMTLGIDSLALIGIAGELAELIGVELRAEILWEHDSISALARQLASVVEELEAAPPTAPSPAESSSDSLESLRQGNGAAPVVLVGYYRGSDSLKAGLDPTIPIWWLKLDGLYTASHEIRPIPEMADAFLEELLAARPTGELALIGFSFSGLIAYELASQLRRRGRAVRLLLLEPARSLGQETAVQKLRRHVRMFGGMNGSERWRYLHRQLRTLREKSHRLLERVQRHCLGKPIQGADRLSPRDGWRFFGPIIRQRINEYHPPPLSGSMMLVGGRSWIAQNAAYWSALIEEPLQLVPLEDVKDHLAIQDLPVAQTWISELDRLLRSNQHHPRQL